MLRCLWLASIQKNELNSMCSTFVIGAIESKQGTQSPCPPHIHTYIHTHQTSAKYKEKVWHSYQQFPLKQNQQTIYKATLNKHCSLRPRKFASTVFTSKSIHHRIRFLLRMSCAFPNQKHGGEVDPMATFGNKNKRTKTAFSSAVQIV